MICMVELIGGPDDGEIVPAKMPIEKLYFLEDGKEYCISLEFTLYENCPRDHLHALAHYAARVPTGEP